MNYEQQELLQKANELLKAGQAERAIEILSQHFGPDHRYVAIGYNALGARQYEEENWAAAKLSIEHARLIWEKECGHESVEVAACANNLARIYENLGDIPMGVQCHREALAIRMIVLGMEHPDTGMSYLGLGAALLSLGEAEEAKQKFTNGLALFTRIGQVNSPEAMACRANIELCETVLVTH